MPKKPQGFNAVTKIIGVEGGPAILEHQTISLPGHKSAAEQTIIKIFAASLPKMPSGTAPIELLDYRQKDENDLDFQITTPEGNFDMELTEFAPLKALKARYENAPNSYRLGDLADLLFDCVTAKNKYGKSGMKKILLVYVTHFAFLPCPDVLELVRSKLSAVGHEFKKIMFFAPVEPEFGIVEPLYPAPFTRLSAAQRRVLREHVVTNFDPRSMIPVEGGAMFSITNEPLKS